MERKLTLSWLLVCSMLLFCFSVATQAAAGDKKVRLPDFPVLINGQALDNQKLKYPFFVYKDITYLPLTWKYAHDMLGLELVWDDAKGLNVIGGQQQVFGAIYYDDADYLYVYPELITEPGRAGLKVKKSLEETPVWMSEEETEELRKRVEELEGKTAGEPASLETKDDGLYYQGLRLMTKEQITVSSGEAGMAQIRELKGARFELSAGITLVSVEKITTYNNIGRSIYEYHTFLILGKEVSEIKELQQPLDRVVANADGSFWLVSNGKPMQGRIMGGSRRLALLDAKGSIRLANEALSESDIAVPGLSTPGLKDRLTNDGKLLIYRSGRSNDGKFTPKDTQGYYWLDTGFNVSKADALDALAKEENSPDRPNLNKGGVYMGSDRKFYLVRMKNNTIFNFSDSKTGRWYDDELLAAR